MACGLSLTSTVCQVSSRSVNDTANIHPLLPTSWGGEHRTNVARRGQVVGPKEQ